MKNNYNIFEVNYSFLMTMKYYIKNRGQISIEYLIMWSILTESQSLKENKNKQKYKKIDDSLNDWA